MVERSIPPTSVYSTADVCTWFNYITIAGVFAKFSAQADWQTRLRCDLLDSTQPAPHCKMSHHDDETGVSKK